MKYLFWDDNFVPAASTTVSESSETTGFLSSQVATRFVAERWRSTSLNAWIEFEFETTKTFNTIVIGNHNLTTNADVTVSAGAAAAPAVLKTLGWREFDIYNVLATNESHKFVRLTFADTSNSDGYIAVGLAQIGSGRETPIQMAQSWARPERFNQRQQFTDVGVLHAEALSRQHIIDVTFSGLSLTEENTLGQINSKSQGAEKPIFIIPKDEENKGYVMNILAYSSQRIENYASATFRFLEQVRGNLIGS